MTFFKKYSKYLISILILISSVGFYYKIDKNGFAIDAIFGITYFLIFQRGMLFLTGQGVMEKNKIDEGVGSFLVFRHWILANFKMPALPFLMVIIFMISCIGNDVYDYFISPDEGMPVEMLNNLRFSIFVKAIPFIMNCVYWKFHWQDLFFFNEQELRMVYQRSEMPLEEIEIRIEMGRRCGLFG